MNNIEIKHFHDLSTDEFHDIVQLRIDIFVVEQECFYPELDGLDKQCYHLLLRNNDRLIGTARILPPQLKFKETSIGRVAVREGFRQQGLARNMMNEVLDFIKRKYPGTGVRISAQQYLKKFYCDLGFTDTGNHYLEDGIPHLEMLRGTA